MLAAPFWVAAAVALSASVPCPVEGGVIEVDAAAVAAFAWSTVALSPGLPTRTLTAVFCTPVCVAAAAAPADWSVVGPVAVPAPVVVPGAGA